MQKGSATRAAGAVNEALPIRQSIEWLTWMPPMRIASMARLMACRHHSRRGQPVGEMSGRYWMLSVAVKK